MEDLEANKYYLEVFKYVIPSGKRNPTKNLMARTEIDEGTAWGLMLFNT